MKPISLLTAIPAALPLAAAFPAAADENLFGYVAGAPVRCFGSTALEEATG